MADNQLLADLATLHGMDPNEFMAAHPTPEPRSRFDMLREDAGNAVDALMPFSAMRYPDTPEARRAWDAATQVSGGKLPPVPGSSRFDPATGAALDVGQNFLPFGKLAAAVPGFVPVAKKVAGSFIEKAGGDLGKAQELYLAAQSKASQKGLPQSSKITPDHIADVLGAIADWKPPAPPRPLRPATRRRPTRRAGRARK